MKYSHGLSDIQIGTVNEPESHVPILKNRIEYSWNVVEQNIKKLVEIESTNLFQFYHRNGNRHYFRNKNGDKLIFDYPAGSSPIKKGEWYNINVESKGLAY